MFHENLRKARERADLSQTELATLIQIPVTTYRNYENTQREPSYEILLKITKALGVSADALIGNEERNYSKYDRLLDKIKKLPQDKLQTVSLFVDFLLSGRL